MLSLKTISSTFSKDPEIDLFFLFQVNLDNYFDIKFALAYHKISSFSETENLPFYEYETHVEKLNEVLKKQQEQRDKEDGQQKQSSNPYGQADKYIRDAKKSAPNMSPKMPKFKL